MSYQVTNTEASIKFASEFGQYLLKKEMVLEISIIRGAILKITSTDCASSIIIKHQDITDPITPSVDFLVDVLSGWINELYTPEPEPEK